MTEPRRLCGGHSSKTHGYCCGGNLYTPSTNKTPTIDRYAFATEDNATDVGDLTVAREAPACSTSATHGYTTGGSFPPYNVNNCQNVIDRFLFANSANATDWADLDTQAQYAAGTTSSTHGYTSGGHNDNSNNQHNMIQKYSFASNANATVAGDLTVARSFTTGVSGISHGYTASGYHGSSNSNVIDKFTFAADNNATDVGDINHGMNNSVGIED